MTPLPPSLVTLPSVDRDGNVTVVIETPKGSPNKYSFDAGANALRLKAVLPEGTAFPYDFGFVPSTLGEDGDPLDVLVFLDAPTPPGCVIAARLIGAIEARQREGEGSWRRNDRLLAVPTQSRAQKHIRSLDDLRPGLLDEIEAFFDHYTRLQGRRFEPIARGSVERARALLDAGREAARARAG